MTDWKAIGRQVALGKKGTGWMMFDLDKMVAKEIVESSHNINKDETDLYAKVYDWAEGWEDTNQFAYEVGNDMIAEAKKTGGENWVEDYSELLDEYLNGYVEGAMKAFNKKKISSLTELKRFAESKAKERLKEVI
jgi:hypothetical protein